MDSVFIGTLRHSTKWLSYMQCQGSGMKKGLRTDPNRHLFYIEYRS